jgi:hypothetical protein
LKPWRLHDLRRTVATRMNELGVLPHVVEAVLNHISGHRLASPEFTTAPPTRRKNARRLIYGPRMS